MDSLLGTIVTVKVDRPIGSTHPEYKDMIYPVNYGYIEGIFAGDKEEVDCYILGVNEPLEEFTGRVIAIIKRLDDNENKMVVSNQDFDIMEIAKSVDFTEKYFKIEIVTWR